MPDPVIDPLDVKRQALAEAMVIKLGADYQVEWHLLRNMPEPVIDRLLDEYTGTHPIYVG